MISGPSVNATSVRTVGINIVHPNFIMIRASLKLTQPKSDFRCPTLCLSLEKKPANSFGLSVNS